ncbi:MAG: NADH-ubiquinone oxidoreductase-F iron-sulfur binding region domain-containing protein [Microthrixaceae bacterium]
MRFQPVLTAAEVRVGPDLDAWLAVGGGEALRRAAADPVAALGAVAHAGVRGLGGAGYPTALKWEPVALARRPDAWIICNGNEDEPGTYKDEFLLRRTPHQVIEGALAAAAVTGAGHVVIYVNPRDAETVAGAREAVEEWLSHPLLAELNRMLGHPLELAAMESSGMYVAGEETAVIAAVEGRFPFPRRKPPFPAERGVHGAPTVVNNVETLAHVGHVLRHGADWYRSLGRGGASGMKLFSLSGDVMHPGLYELPLGTSLHELVMEHGGGLIGDKALKAVVTGGPSNTLLTADDLDVALDFDSVSARGARLGTGAMIVLAQGTSIVRTVARYMAFFAAGSCGQCPPCRIGTQQVESTLRRIDAGFGTPADLDSLEKLVPQLRGSGRCGLIDGAMTVLDSSIATFRDEYLAQVAPSEGARRGGVPSDQVGDERSRPGR